MASVAIREAPTDAKTSVVIFGATSALAQATARQLAERGLRLHLVARNAEKLASVAADLSARGASINTTQADLDQIDQHDQLLDSIGGIEECWFFYGVLPDQQQCEIDWQATATALHTNFTSTASLLTRVANQLASRNRGLIVVVSSVAGDRGRGSNYVYGSAKGALALFCQGLRNRLAPHGVRVLTVKPGFIDTPMTAHVEKKPAALWATPERVANDMLKARDGRRDVLYTPWFWQPIMCVIRSIPERVFKGLSL